MNYLIILLLVILIVLVLSIHKPKEQFFIDGPALVNKGDTLNLDKPNENKFTLSLAFPISLGNQVILNLGKNISFKTIGQKNIVNVSLESEGKILAEYEKYYKNGVEENIISNKLYNFSIVFKKDRIETVFENEIKNQTLDEKIIDNFKKIDSLTYKYDGIVQLYEFSNEARNYNYICNQNNTCKFNCDFLNGKNDSEQMGGSPETCFENCKVNNSCTPEICYDICIDPNTRLWKPSDNRCEFSEPFGTSPSACVENCKKMGPNCSTLECENICNSCDNPDNCKWVEPHKKIENPNKSGDVKSPDVSFEQLDGGVVLNWEKNEDNVEAYLIVYYETEMGYKGRNLRVIKADKDDYSEKILNLNENKFYTFIVRAYSFDQNLSENYRPIVVKPQKYNTEVPTEEIEISDLPDFYKFCNL